MQAWLEVHENQTIEQRDSSNRWVIAAQILVVVAGLVALTLADTLGASLTGALALLAAFVIGRQIFISRRQSG